jgi:hypothetical protein
MHMDMKTLILKIDNAINASRIYEVVKLFKGVKQARIVTQEEEKEVLNMDSKSVEREDLELLTAIQDGRTGRFVNTEEFVKKLRK